MDPRLSNLDSRLAEWLIEQDSWERHKCALSWNWGWGVAVLDWILDCPDCDQGTALGVYNLGHPHEQVSAGGLEAIKDGTYWNMECVNFLVSICRRWAAGKYRTYRYHPGNWGLEYDDLWRESVTTDPDLALAIARRLPWDEPADMTLAPSTGRVPDLSGYTEGFPNELLRSLKLMA